MEPGEEPGSARSGAGTDLVPPQVGEPLPPSPGSDTQRGRKDVGEEGKCWGANIGVDGCKEDERGTVVHL